MEQNIVNQPPAPQPSANQGSTSQPLPGSPLTSSLGLFAKSKEIVLKNIKIYAMIFLLPFLLGLIGNLKTAKSSSPSSTMYPGVGGNFKFTASLVGVGLLVALIILVIYIIITVMQYALNLEASKGKKPELDDLWAIVKKFGWRTVGLSFLVGLLIIVGTLLFVVPGLIFYRRYFLAPYVLIDQDLSIDDAMKESARISKPNSGSVWGVIGVTILLSLPGLIPVVGWAISFILTMLYAAAPAMRYLELKKLMGTAPSAASVMPQATPQA